MMTREDMQNRIDVLDGELLAQLTERLELTQQLADTRRDRSLVIGDDIADAALLARAEAAGGSMGEYLRQIYAAIIACDHQQQAKRLAVHRPRVIDITRELLSSEVYPGDPAPVLTRIGSIAEGRRSNLSALSLCVHNGTHLDSPLHFVDGAADITEIDIESTVGRCLVEGYDHDVTAEDIAALPADTERLLIKGGVYLTPGGAQAAAEAGLRLVGVEPQSVAPTETSQEVHCTLLEAGVIILEGLDLYHVCSGCYTLAAQPLKIKGCEGSPCRALLIND